MQRHEDGDSGDNPTVHPGAIIGDLINQPIAAFEQFHLGNNHCRQRGILVRPSRGNPHAPSGPSPDPCQTDIRGKSSTSVERAIESSASGNARFLAMGVWGPRYGLLTYVLAMVSFGTLSQDYGLSIDR